MMTTKEAKIKKSYSVMNGRRCSIVFKLGIILLLVKENHGKVTNKSDNSDCSIQIDGGLPEPQPLILRPIKGKNEFLYPTEPGSGHLVASSGESFRVACPGSKLVLNTTGSYEDTLVTCVGGTNFVIRDANIEESFDKISCEKYPTYEIKRTGVPCGNGVSLEIGSPLQTPTTSKKKRPDFLGVIDLCHNEILGHTIYAHTKIFAVIDAAQKSFGRPAFRRAKFYRGIPIDKVYSRNSQRQTIGRILNSTTLALQYIPEKGQNFFSRGHLIAKADLIYGSQQRATFFYVNTVPMWQSINAGNFGRMESDVRLYASESNLDLDVWVGSVGILSLQDLNGREREIYLHIDGNKRAVPVPKTLFKVVYNKPSRSGIVFLTENNPYLKSLTAEYKICKDVCHMIDYMKWKPDMGKLGFSYCCEIDDFRKAFPNLPSFETVRLLK